MSPTPVGQTVTAANHKSQHLPWYVALTLVCGSAVGVWWWPGVYFPLHTASDPHLLYLLSATAQSLAAIFGLVATIVLIVAQLSGHISRHLPARLFDKEIAAYVALYGAGILLPLAWMDQPTPSRARMTLTLTSLCLVALIPYFATLRRRLDPLWAINRLFLEAQREIRSGQGLESPSMHILDTAVLTALDQRDYATMERALRAVEDLTIEAFSTGNHEVGTAILHKLGRLRLSVVGHPLGERHVVNALTLLAMALYKNGQDSGAQQTIRLVEVAGCEAVEARRETAATWVAADLRALVSFALTHDDPDGAGLAADSLSQIARDACRHDLEGTALLATNHLSAAGQECSRGGHGSVVEKIRDGLESILGPAGSAGFARVYTVADNSRRSFRGRPSDGA